MSCYWPIEISHALEGRHGAGLVPVRWESLANAIGFPNNSYRNMGAIYIYCNCFWCSLIVVQNYITDIAISHTFCIEEMGGKCRS
jgi:hypothetical protein